MPDTGVFHFESASPWAMFLKKKCRDREAWLYCVFCEAHFQQDKAYKNYNFYNCNKTKKQTGWLHTAFFSFSVKTVSLVKMSKGQYKVKTKPLLIHILEKFILANKLIPIIYLHSAVTSCLSSRVQNILKFNLFNSQDLIFAFNMVEKQCCMSALMLIDLFRLFMIIHTATSVIFQRYIFSFCHVFCNTMLQWH